GDDRLDLADDLSADQYRIDAKMRAGGVAAAALDLDGDAIGRSHYGARAQGKFADRQAWEIMHPVDFFNAEALHEPVANHGPAPCPTLFGGLEDHHRGTGKIACLSEIASRAQQHRGMTVMATGMHLSRYGG